jgi:hypothetical protein
MPVYHFRLTDTETGEFRNVSVSAASKEEAEEVIYRQEMKKVNFQSNPDDVKDLESKLKSGTLSGREKARLFAHRQEKPYTVQKAKED